MAKKKPETIVQLSKIRMPRSLHEQLSDDAKLNKRSLNGEIVARLERSFGDYRELAESKQSKDAEALRWMLGRDPESRAFLHWLIGQLQDHPDWSSGLQKTNDFFKDLIGNYAAFQFARSFSTTREEQQ